MEAKQDKKEFEEAMEFLASMRGRYIVSQALHYAIKHLESVEPEHLREYSNIKDMEYSRKTLFPFFLDVQA